MYTPTASMHTKYNIGLRPSNSTIMGDNRAYLRVCEFKATEFKVKDNGHKVLQSSRSSRRGVFGWRVRMQQLCPGGRKTENYEWTKTKFS